MDNCIQKNDMSAARLRVGRRWLPTLDYVSKMEEENPPVNNGLRYFDEFYAAKLTKVNYVFHSLLQGMEFVTWILYGYFSNIFYLKLG